MTDQNLTEIVCIVDRSGSMGSIRNDAIGGFNTFLADQRKVPGRCLMTYVQFDDVYEVVHNGVPLDKIPNLDDITYQPRGSTALLDAVGKTINQVGARLANMTEDQRPGKILVVILTDGHENASREFNRQQVFDMIKTQRDTYSWEFIFLAAGIDAFDAGAAIGVWLCSSATHDSKGIQANYLAASCAATQYRTTGHVGQDDLDNAVKSNSSSVNINNSNSNSNPVH